MSADRLAEIKAREQAAFGGPWEALDADENGMHAVAVDGTVLVEVGDFCDAEFIAHARDDIPHLLALVESLTAERDALQVGRDRDRVKGAVAVLNEELRTSEQEDRAQKAEAEVGTLRANWRHVTKSLGYGDGVTEPQIGHVEFVAECERQFSEASEWRESQRWRDECHDAGHPDDEDCYEHDPALVLLTLRAKVAAVEAHASRLAASLALTLYDAHPVYGSTALWHGGVGGQAITAHCAIINGGPPGMEWAEGYLPSMALSEFIATTPGFDLDAAKAAMLTDLRAALAGSDADTGEQETGHKCEPYYSRSECGRCGWQEQWCATCSRQMCRCATDAMGADQ